MGEVRRMTTRVLIVAAEVGLAAGFRAGLGVQGCAVDLAERGRVGLDLIATTRYDVVIFDDATGDIDTIGFCQHLRADGHRMPIILLVADDTPQAGIAGLDAGADTYLAKPVALAELLARIRALRRRAAQPATTVLRVADLTLDPVAHEVHRGGQPVALTRTEYAILEYLLRHPNQVLSHAQIAAAAWDDGLAVTSDVLKVHMAALRRKLRDERTPRLLHTVRGRGYSIRLPA